MADTITESVVWTLCPNGRDKSGNLHFSVFVAPRLIASAGRTTLATPTVWQNWPELLKRCKFSVVVPGTGDAPRAVDRTSGWSSDVYASLFPASTPVISYNTALLDSLKSGLILSYPVKTLADHIEKVYAAIAASGEDMPKVGVLQDAGWPGYRNKEERRRDSAGQPPTHQQRINAYRAALKHGVAQDMKGVFETFSLYHTPLLAETTMVQQHQHTHRKMVAQPLKATPGQLEQLKPGFTPTEASWPGFVHPKLPMPEDLSKITDFHKIAAALSNYRQLSRLCGFVIDFTMTKDVAEGLHPNTPLALRVLRDGHPNPADTCASTVCLVSPGDFAAFDPTHDYDNGFVRINHSGLDLIQLDVDGAAHKAAALGSSLERMTVTNFSDDETDQPRQDDMRTSTPSLRSAGLMVAKTGRSGDVSKRAQRNAALHGLTAPELDFGDLLRGYRADIMDTSEDPPRWRSLHRRTIEYTFRNPVAGAETLKWHTEGGKTIGASPEEEGVISTSVGSSPDGSVPDVYTLHEGVFVWRGWSLSAPEPFRTMRHRPDSTKKPDDHESMIGDNDAEVPDGLPLQTRFVVRSDPDGNLPRLRFGHSYTVRLRTVDMCGNSLPLSARSTPGVETEPARYRRYEPIESPVITLIGKVDPGDKTANWKNAELPLQGESMTRIALRTRNVTYDDPANKPEAASVHRGVWPPRVTQRFAEQHGVLDDDKGKLRPDLYVMLVDTDDAFAEASVPASDAVRGPVAMPDPYKGQTTSYAVSHGDLPIPYLPDPLAVRAKVRLLLPDGNTWSETQIAFHAPGLMIDDAVRKPWDKDGPPVKGIVIEGRETMPTGHETDNLWFDPAQRVLYVHMPRGKRQRLRISFMVPPSRLDMMALWALMDKGKSTDDIKGKILAGRHWMFTPWRDIELVHAVQKPLKMPIFIALTPWRAFGATDASLTWNTPVDGHSTVRIDLNATWNEPDDNDVSVDAKTHPVHRPHSAQISQQAITRHQGNVSTSVTHHFHDTRARRVTYTMDAISRFKEFFEKPLRDSENDMKITSAKDDEWIKSSARPPAPVVLYAIPTFGWFTEDGLIKASRRTGGIRVWLDRPWLATGYNEMLAVILPEEKNGLDTSDTAPNLPFVTQWGRDPITLSSDIATNSPARKHFPLAKLKGPIDAPGANVPAGEGAIGDFPTTGLQVPKQPGTFAIAPHQVGFDADRELWYADIVVDIPKGSYFPFVRLAVARYQPTSLEWDAKDGPAPNGDTDLHLSSPVTCDFMQISADRIAVLVPIKGNAYRVVVFGDTSTDDGRPVEAKTKVQPNVIRVRTQVLDAKVDPVAGWRDVDGKPQTDVGPVVVTEKADTSVQAAKSVAAGLAKRDIAAPMGTRGGPTAVAVSDGMVVGSFGPNILFEGVVYLPNTPANGRRRVLITESEVYPRPALNHEEDPGTAERIVYAEGLEV